MDRSATLTRVVGGKRLPLVVLCLAAGAAGAILAITTHSSAARAQSAPLDTAQAIALLSGFNIDATPLPSSTPGAISEQQAEAAALKHFGQGTSAGVTASLVRATDTKYATVAADGTRTPLVSNRTVWLVLIPDQQIPIFAPKGKSDQSTYTATTAVLIDANSGDYLEAAALNS